MALEDFDFAMAGGFLPTWGMKLCTGVSRLTPEGGRGLAVRGAEESEHDDTQSRRGIQSGW